MKRRPSMKEVARLAGVSTSTVSHVVNATRFVGEEPKRRVLAAIESLDYHPNLLARGLKGKGSRTVGMVVANLRDSFYYGLVNAVSRRLHAAEYDVLVCDSEYDLAMERRHIDALTRKGIDGLVLSGLGRDEPYPALLDADFPLVQVYDRIDAYHTDFVGIDAEAEARRITAQMVARGCRRIGMLRYAGHFFPGSRYAGFRAVCLQHGIWQESLTLRVPVTDTAGADDAVREWWQHNQPVDGVICTNANVCLALLRLFNSLDLTRHRLPLVVSFDESPWMQHLRYPVAALRQPVGRIGATVAAAILARIKGDSGPAAHTTYACDITWPAAP